MIPHLNEQTKLVYDRKADRHLKENTNFGTLIFMVIPCLLLNGVVIIFGYILGYMPVIETIDDILTRIYALGQYIFIFALFLITYILTGEHRSSGGGIINKNVLKFWKWFYKRRSVHTLPLYDMSTDKDKADALMAAVIYQLTRNAAAQIDQYQYFWEIMMDGSIGRPNLGM